MTELDPGAKELIALAGTGDGPSDSERARLRASVLAQVGTGALGAKAGGAVASAALGAVGAGAAGAVVSSAGAGAGAVAAGGSVAVFAAKMVAIGAVLTGVGAGGYVAVSHHAKSAEVAPVATKSAEQAPEKMVPIGATAARRGQASTAAAPSVDPEPSASAAPEPPPAEVPANVPPPAPVARQANTTHSAPVVSESVPETIEEETVGLRQALSSLRAKHPDVALTQLDGEDARFPRGALAEERAVARIEALCALGRTSDAAAVGARFLTQHPRSLQAARVRASCAGSQTAPGGR